MNYLSILYLEDNEFDVELVKSNLEAEGIDFNLQHVTTRAEFVAALEKGPLTREGQREGESGVDEQFDIILTDYSLPTFDGVTALALAAEMCPDVPVIMVSGTVGEEIAIETMKKGATDYVLKQRMERLSPTIMRALEEAAEFKARKRAEAALRKSEEKYRALFSKMAEGVYLHEIIYSQKGEAVDYRIIETNPASEKHLNIKQEDANGKLATEIYGTEEAPYLDIYAKVAKTRIPFNFEEYFPPLKKYFHISVYSPEKGKFATVFQDITERMQMEESLQKSEELFSKAFYNHPTAMQIVNIKTGKRVDINESCIQLFGVEKEKFLEENAFLSKMWVDPEVQNSVAEKLRRDGFINNYPSELINQSGKIRNLLNSGCMLEIGDGNVAIMSFVDITERVQAEKKLIKANRLYATLSQINQTIVKEHNKQELFQKICDIAVDYGKFKLAWIGLVNEENQSVIPVAFSGEGSGYLQNINISLTSETTGKGPTGRSIREGKSIVFNDLENNPDFAPWRKRALEKGYRSSGAFPIRLDTKVIGALMVYAVEPNFFDEDEIKLLEEGAQDISFALEKMKEEEKRKQAEEKEQEHFRNIAFLSETAMNFVDFPPEKDIYAYIGEHLSKLVGKDSYIIMSSVNAETSISTVRAVLGTGKFTDQMTKLFKRNPVGMTFEINNENLLFFSDGKLHEYKEGLYGICLKTIPKAVCNSIEKLLEIKSIFILDLFKEEQLFGSIIILLKIDAAELQNKQIIETFIKQASIAVQKRRAEEALRESEAQMQTLIDAMPDYICFKDGDGHWLKVNNACIRIFQLENIDYRGNKDSELAELNNQLQDTFLTCKETDAMAWEEGRLIRNEEAISLPDGSVRYYDVAKVPVFHPGGERKGLIVLGHDITERKQAQEKERQHFQGISFLTESAMSFVDFPPDKDIYHYICKKLKELAGESIVVVNSMDEARGILTTRAILGMGKHAKGILKLFGRHPEGAEYNARDESLAYLLDGRLHNDEGGLYGILLGKVPEAACLAIEKLYHLNKIYAIGFIEGKKLFGSAIIFLSKGNELKSETIIETFIKQASIAVKKRQAEKSLKRYTRQLETLNTVTTALSSSLELDKVLHLILNQVGQVLTFISGSIFLLEEDGLRVVIDHGVTPSVKGHIFPAENELFKAIQRTKTPLISNNVKNDPRFQNWGHSKNVESWMGVPLIVRDTLIGFLALDNLQPGAYSSEQVNLVRPFASQAAQAIENARQFSQANMRLKRLDDLHTIDKAIISSFDLKVPLHVLLERLRTQLEVDAAAVLRYEKDLQVLTFSQGLGFRTTTFQHTSLRLGEGHAGKAALQRRSIFIPDFTRPDDGTPEYSDFKEEGFVAYYGVPLIAKDALVGVLEIFQRSALNPNDEWVDYLHVLAGQAAIAIDNSTLFNDLQHSNVKLVQAYDATIEGWVHALELRDWETEGHSRRVVEMTMQLAPMLGFRGEKLAHIWRGALLHDIGKMGVPDAILQKPGKLNDEEWQIMRQHPVYAYEWLSPIEYLQPALDIPYCHHEKWDGSGYPRGLQGEQIPLAARIFAVIDVWDALQSDRPYRKAWSREKTLTYIRELSGKHFDPQVVDIFIKYLGEDGGVD